MEEEIPPFKMITQNAALCLIRHTDIKVLAKGTILRTETATVDVVDIRIPGCCHLVGSYFQVKCAIKEWDNAEQKVWLEEMFSHV